MTRPDPKTHPYQYNVPRADLGWAERDARRAAAMLRRYGHGAAARGTMVYTSVYPEQMACYRLIGEVVYMVTIAQEM